MKEEFADAFDENHVFTFCLHTPQVPLNGDSMNTGDHHAKEPSPSFPALRKEEL
jgi:hypothetical protein